jgi:glycogen(starch) synthase
VLADTHRRVPETVRYSSVLYNGLDTPIEAPTPLPTDAPQLLCLGRLKRHKGFDLALTAFASIVSRFPRAQLTIAGDGPERPKLEQQAQSLGLGNAVAFTCWVAPQDVPPLVNTASLVVMPSRREAFGLVALDAAVMARPIVATRVGGLVEVVEHQHTGLLVENEEAEALAQAIAFLLNHPQVAIRLGQAARQRAQERFSWQQYVTAYERLYKKLSARAD